MRDTIIQGDVLTVLKTLPDGLVNCVVTSPPYWGLRDYGASGQLGLEPTIEEYVRKMTEVFREVRRVLKDEGTLWLNMGDGYAANGGIGSPGATAIVKNTIKAIQGRPTTPSGLKPKDLIGQPWHVATIRGLRPRRIFFAYDTPDDLEPLREAGRMLLAAGFTKASHALRCYVLIGYRGDTFEKAERRFMETIDIGFMPMAMLYRNGTGERDLKWARFQTKWARATIIAGRMGA